MEPIEPEIGRAQIENSTANPWTIVTALGLMGALVVGYVLFSSPQGMETASNSVGPTEQGTSQATPSLPTPQGGQGSEKLDPEK